MQRDHVSLVIVSLLSSMICACADLREILRELREQQQPGWTYLLVLDDQTLERLATLPIDRYVARPRFSNGRLLVDGPSVSFVIDVHDPKAPRISSYLPNSAASAIIGDRIFTYAGFGVRVFDATAENGL